MPDLDRADSVTVDPHKWFFQAYDIGGLLVRDGAHLGQVVRRPGARVLPRWRGRRPTGSTDDDHDDHGDQLNFYKLSFEGTRRWRALKLWMSWKHLGTEGFGRLIEANDDLAALLARRCAESDDFEAIPDVPELSVVCFRHLPGGRAAALDAARATLDAHQDRLQAALEVSGDGWLTTTRLRGATWLRAGIVNYLSTEADIDRLLATLRQPGCGGLTASPSRTSPRSGAATSVASRRIPAAPSRAGSSGGSRRARRGRSATARSNGGSRGPRVGRDDDLGRQRQLAGSRPIVSQARQQRVAPLLEALERPAQVRGVVPAVGVARREAQPARPLATEPDRRTARMDRTGLHHRPVEPVRRRVQRHAGRRRAPRR